MEKLGGDLHSRRDEEIHSGTETHTRVHLDHPVSSGTVRGTGTTRQSPSAFLEKSSASNSAEERSCVRVRVCVCVLCVCLKEQKRGHPTDCQVI